MVLPVDGHRESGFNGVERMRFYGVADVPRKIGLRMSARPARLAWPGGVVSFTFDDFPKSALAVGGNILESYASRGTYYASMGFAGSHISVGRIFDYEDICTAHRDGHEIACHTHSHLDCGGSARRSILDEIRRNAAALSSVLEGFAPIDFAYPHGRISPIAKHALGSRFSSCRGGRSGINYGIIDLADLLAVTIYASSYDRFEMYRLIDHTMSVGGWLIFLTHDVVDAPSRYGCKPGQLEAVVAYASKHTSVMPVRDVVARVRPLRAIPGMVYKAIPGRVYEKWNTL
jgi:peptidoglycan/xylan/chitin deacetylase (PgdA/CDA1 family)